MRTPEQGPRYAEPLDDRAALDARAEAILHDVYGNSMSERDRAVAAAASAAASAAAAEAAASAAQAAAAANRADLERQAQIAAASSPRAFAGGRSTLRLSAMGQAPSFAESLTGPPPTTKVRTKARKKKKKTRRAASSTRKGRKAKRARDSKPVLPSQLAMGNAVSVSGYADGIIKFIGPTFFGEGIWVGVELLKPVGKHDGAVYGYRYFKCKDRYGVFVRPKDITYTTQPQKWIPIGV